MAEENQPFSPDIGASETRQAQHIFANDVPIDINLNAVCGRVQAAAFTNAHNEFQAASARRAAIFDHVSGVKINQP